MKILSNVTMAGNVDMSSTNKDTFTIGSELERDNPNADELKVWANAKFYNDVQLGSSSVDVTSVKGEFRTSGSIYLDGQTSTIYLGQQDFVDYVTTNLNGLKQSEVTGAGVGIISDQDPSKYYLKSFVGDLDRINVTSENNNSEIHIELAPQQYDYSVLTPSTGTLGSGETSQSEAFYLKNNDTQNVTHSLPDAQAFVKRLFVIKNSSTQYNILLNASGSQLIDGNSSLTLPINTSYTLQAIDDNGYKWKIVGSFNEPNLLVTGSLTVGENIRLTPVSTPPTPQEGQIYYDSTKHELVYNSEVSTVLNSLGRSLLVRAKNTDSVTLTKGMAVRVSTPQGANKTFVRALSVNIPLTGAAGNQIIGIINSDIAVNDFGYATTFGEITGLNTNTFIEGDQVYVSSTTSGSLTGSRPTAPFEIIPVGICLSQHATQGKIFVKTRDPTHFGDITGFNPDTTALTNGQVIRYRSSDGTWGNSNSGVVLTGSFSGSLIGTASNLEQTAWTSYTPTWTAASTNPVIGNGTIEGYYKVIGKTCFVRGNIVMGSTTTFGSGEWYVSMPFTASHADAILMTVTLLDNGTAWYNATMAGARAGFNTKAPIQYQNTTNGTANDVNATQPFTWTSTDRFIWNGSYEIA